MENTNTHQQVVSITDSYHRTAELYIGYFKKFFGVAAIPAFITVVLGFSVEVSVIAGFARLTNVMDFFNTTNSHFIVSLLIVLTIALVQGIGVIAMTYMAVHYEHTAVHGAFEHALAFFWRFLGLGAVVLLASIVGLVVGFVVVVIIAIPIGIYSIDAMNTSFNTLTIIPLITSSLATSFFLFAPYSMIDNNSSITKALQHSIRLVRGHFWPVIIRFVLMYAILTICILALRLLAPVGNILFLLFISPLLVIYLSVLYQHMKSFKS